MQWQAVAWQSGIPRAGGHAGTLGFMALQQGDPQAARSLAFASGPYPAEMRCSTLLPQQCWKKMEECA